MPFRPQYKIGVSRFLSWLGPRSINEETVRNYFIFLKRDFSPATVRLAKTAIKLWILKNHSERTNVVFRNGIEAIFKEIKVPVSYSSISESKLLSLNEIALLANHLPVKYALILKTLYITGSRISEILSLRIKNCQILNDYVEARFVAKGSREVTVVLSIELFEEIRSEFKGKIYLFENSRTGRPLSRQLVHRVFQKFGREVLKRKIHPHQIRHSRITHLLKSGKPLDAVSRFAHHYEPAFTAKFYGHNRLSPDEIISTFSVSGF